MVSLDDRVSVPSHVLVRFLDKESVLLNIETERYFGLDETGTRMWQLVTAAPKLEVAYQQLLDEYDVEPELLRENLTDLVSRLVENGLLQVSSSNVGTSSTLLFAGFGSPRNFLARGNTLAGDFVKSKNVRFSSYARIPSPLSRASSSGTARRPDGPPARLRADATHRTHGQRGRPPRLAWFHLFGKIAGALVAAQTPRHRVRTPHRCAQIRWQV